MNNELVRSRGKWCFAAACVVLLSLSGLAGCRTVAYPRPQITAAVADNMHGMGQPFDTGGGADLVRHGENDFEVTLPRFDAVKVTQSRGDWCWAACSEMLLRLDGQEADQKTIVQKFGDPLADNQAEPETVVMLALNPDLRERFDRTIGRLVVPDLGLVPANADDLAREMSRGRALVAGLADPRDSSFGHAVVVVGVRYGLVSRSFGERLFMDATPATFEQRLHSAGNQGGPRQMVFSRNAVYAVTIWDPLKAQYETLTGEQFSDRVSFLFSRDMAREVLQKSMASIEESQRQAEQQQRSTPKTSLGDLFK